MSNTIAKFADAAVPALIAFPLALMLSTAVRAQPATALRLDTPVASVASASHAPAAAVAFAGR